MSYSQFEGWLITWDSKDVKAMTWSAGGQKFEQDEAIAAFAKLSKSHKSTEWQVHTAYKTNMNLLMEGLVSGQGASGRIKKFMAHGQTLNHGGQTFKEMNRALGSFRELKEMYSKYLQ